MLSFVIYLYKHMEPDILSLMVFTAGMQKAVQRVQSKDIMQESANFFKISVSICL